MVTKEFIMSLPEADVTDDVKEMIIPLEKYETEYWVRETEDPTEYEEEVEASIICLAIAGMKDRALFWIDEWKEMLIERNK